MSTFVRFAAGALLALGLASSAHAGDELHLRWDNCFSDGGTYNKLFACDTNSGEDILVGSFRLGQTTDRIDGIEGILDIAGFDPALPPWWQYQTGGCRQNSIQVSFAPPVTSSACLDPAPAGGGIAYEYPYGNGARLRFTWALFYPTLTALAGQEVFAFQLHIGRAGTVGSPACAGCNTPVCIGWGWAEIER